MKVLILFQNVIPAEVSLVCVVKPDEFWDKKVTHFCFWKEKDRLGFEVSLSCCSPQGFRTSELTGVDFTLPLCSEVCLWILKICALHEKQSFLPFVNQRFSLSWAILNRSGWSVKSISCKPQVIRAEFGSLCHCSNFPCERCTFILHP